MNSYSLFRRSRLRLALWYAGVMGVILSVSGLGMYRAMVQTNWAAMEREIESIAGTYTIASNHCYRLPKNRLLCCNKFFLIFV